MLSSMLELKSVPIGGVMISRTGVFNEAREKWGLELVHLMEYMLPSD